MTEKTASSYVLFADYPDLDVIRVEDTYYMVSTTMHFMPGCVILRSHNLVDWEIASYVYDELDGTPGQRLDDGKGVYGQGMWAASIRFHKGTFYVSFVANDTHRSYLYTAPTVEGPWKKHEMQGFYHDMSLLFDEDDEGNTHVYVVSGNTDIVLTELADDLSRPKAGGICKTIITDTTERLLGYEGSHIYKIDGRYYVFLIHWPKGGLRTESCFRADSIEGPYTGGAVLSSGIGGWDSGVAQGGIVDTPDGRWFGMLFQDHGALGRIPVLVPVSFRDGWPVFGETRDGTQVAPETVTVPDLRPDHAYKPLWNDAFADEGGLLSTWQWNHISEKSLIQLSADELILTTDRTVPNVCPSVNTLTQRPVPLPPPSPEAELFSASVTLDFSGISDGDYAGIAALEGDYSCLAVTRSSGKPRLVLLRRASQVEPYRIGSVDQTEPREVCSVELCSGTWPAQTVELCCEFDFRRDGQEVQFAYRPAGTVSGGWEPLGPAQDLRYTLDQFVGCRFALFAYSTQKAGGKARFSSVKGHPGRRPR